MDTNQKPIEQFFSRCNSNMDMLYEAMPYVNLNLKKPLALFIKLQEMQEIMHGFNDTDTLSACGLDEPSHNLEDMLYAMRSKANGRPANQLDMILNVIQAEKIYHAFQEASRVTAENSLSSDGNSSIATENGESSYNNDLLSRLLPLLLSNNNGTRTSSADMAAMIQNAMKGDSYESKLA